MRKIAVASIYNILTYCRLLIHKTWFLGIFMVSIAKPLKNLIKTVFFWKKIGNEIHQIFIRSRVKFTVKPNR